MKVTVETEKSNEVIELVRAVNRLEIAEYVIKQFELACYEDSLGGEIPCVVCGGLGHEDGCEWWNTILRIKKVLGVE